MKAVCIDSTMTFTNTDFVGDLSKSSSENISFQLAKSKYICPKVGNFEHYLIRTNCLREK